VKIIFISGPYRSDTEYGVHKNIQNAEAVALRVWQLGHVAFCPHKNTAYFGGVAPDALWLEGDLEVLRRCDAVVLVPGWEKSSGVRAEVELAKELGLPIYLNPEAMAKELA
jgi:hypothetical protein